MAADVADGARGSRESRKGWEDVAAAVRRWVPPVTPRPYGRGYGEVGVAAAVRLWGHDTRGHAICGGMATRLARAATGGGGRATRWR